MGRKIPAAENPSIHPVLSPSLLVACFAATITIISSLCGIFSRKKSLPPEQEATENSHVITPSDEAARTSDSPPGGMVESSEVADTTRRSQNDEHTPLPPPPSMTHSRAASYSFRSTSMAPCSKLSSSMRVPPSGGAMLRQQSRRWDDNNIANIEKKKGKKLKQEDSIWKKTIILGERCRVPDEEDGTVLYGNKIERYHHRKTPTSVPVSRQTSGIDIDSIPS